MPIDRAAILKNAEKLLRQGKLNPAIAEYLRIVEEQPRDWNTANILGDLYVRGKQIDKAVDQFVRIADSLLEQGFLPKASAIYKKILKVKPDDEHALLQAAEIAASQELFADARSYLNTVAERRRTKGDQRGVAQIKIRLAALDPQDIAARITGARARVELKDAEGALRDLKELAAELSEKGRQAEAVQVLDEAATLKPDDPETRERLFKVHLESGDFVRAREYASTAEQCKEIAARFESAGRAEEALAMLQEAAGLDPSDTALQTHLARVFIAKGDSVSAANYLTAESAGSDSQLLLTLAEARLRGGHLDEGMALARRVLELGQEHRQEVAMVGWAVSEQSPSVGFQLVEMAADAAATESDWPSAAAALQEFVTRVPNHIPALMRLVEICVDGRLEATMYAAQAQLTDAYIAAGSAAEARFIAEDLVAREPWDRANIERFRRALILSGELDPDAIIAERLSGESPFMSTDLTFSEELPNLEPDPVPLESEPVVHDEPQPIETTQSSEPVTVAAEPPVEVAVESSEESIPSQAKSAKSKRTKSKGHATKRPAVESRDDAELEAAEDLNIALDELEPARPSGDLDGVFARLRSDLSRRSENTSSDEQYQNGVASYEAGRLDEAIPDLEAASQSPQWRFVAASLLGRIHQKRGTTERAVEWFERAAQAPPPSAEEGRLLLYDLAGALESAGDLTRALAIYLELQSEAGNYRDVSARVDRLAKVQARG